MSDFKHGMVFETDDGDLYRLCGELEPHQWEVYTWWNGSWACMGEEVHDSEFVTRREDMEHSH